MPARRSDLRTLSFSSVLLLSIPVLACALHACSERAATGEGWLHEITTVGNVKTVRTLGGSVWGGTARLVEEASIGVIEGPDEYMLGSVSSICANGGRIFVVDRQVPVVRMYSYGGEFLKNIGRQGGGPGEYDGPTSIRVSPVDGTIFLRDGSQGRMNVYDSEGEPLDTWPLRSGFMTSHQLVVTPDGHPYTYVWTLGGDDFSSRRMGMVRVGPKGIGGDTLLVPEFDFEPWTIEYRSENSWIQNSVPFSPSEVWTMSPLLVMIGGVSTDYHFEIQHPDGSKVVVVKDWEKVPVEPAEGRWYKARETANMRSMAPGWVWNGKEVPSYKPPFDEFVADNKGRIWVRRPGPGIFQEGCNEDPEESAEFWSNPCWIESYTMEVFDLDGRFLGQVEIPAGMQTYPEPYIVDDLVLAVIEGEDGVPYVKRFRLELPPSH